MKKVKRLSRKVNWQELMLPGGIMALAVAMLLFIIIIAGPKVLLAKSDFRTTQVDEKEIRTLICNVPACGEPFLIGITPVAQRLMEKKDIKIAGDGAFLSLGKEDLKLFDLDNDKIVIDAAGQYLLILSEDGGEISNIVINTSTIRYEMTKIVSVTF